MRCCRPFMPLFTQFSRPRLCFSPNVAHHSRDWEPSSANLDTLAVIRGSPSVDGGRFYHLNKVMEKPARRLLAQKLRLLRMIKGWSQETLAQVSGLDRSYVGSIERGERNVSLDNIEKLAGAFGIALDELLGAPNAAQIGDRLIEKLIIKRKES